MSGCVGLQSAGPPAAWLSPVWAGELSEGSAVRDELDSEPPHPASTRTSKVATSAHPNCVLFAPATKLLLPCWARYASLMVTGGPAHRGAALTYRPDTWSNMPATCRYPRRSSFSLDGDVDEAGHHFMRAVLGDVLVEA